MGDSIAWYLVSSLILLQAGTYAQNSTMSEFNDTNVGWQDGPFQRGTMTILWTCLSTVITCTWTILHLNVPRRFEGPWETRFRKAKWMGITILFPEFVFAKAVCELQMAVEDLQAMKIMDKTRLGSWEVSCNRGVDFLQMIFSYFAQEVPFAQSPRDGEAALECPKRETEVSKILNTVDLQTLNAIHPTRVWTLTHSYLANMGGLDRYAGRENGSVFIPVTSNALVNCCLGSDHDPLPSLYLSKDDINDKDKADFFVKVLALVQVLWLILSVVARAVKKLPISQLELCTCAFATLAVLTFSANWSKPKDFAVPIPIRMIPDTSACEVHNYYAEPFMRFMLKPSERWEPGQQCRIGNDYVRMKGLVNPMTVMITLSTILFGGLHCSAWNFEFPTRIEMMVWMVASVISATLPLAAIVATFIVASAIHKNVKICSKHLEQALQIYEGTHGKREKKPMKRFSKADLKIEFDRFKRGTLGLDSSLVSVLLGALIEFL